MPYIGRDLNRGNYLKLDDISSSFNGNTKTFNLTSGGTAFIPGSSLSILVSVGGVILEPETAYQINNSEITFTTAPSGSDNFFCIVLGVALGVNTVADGTVNGAQVAKPFNYDNYFHLDSTNNRVGISSSIPSVDLDVGGTVKALVYKGPTHNSSGISTFFDLKVTNNLTVEGTTTTLDTEVREVDKLEVGADNTTVGVAITQSGIGDALTIDDGTDRVLTVTDGGKVGIGTTDPTGAQKLHVYANSTGTGGIIQITQDGIGDAAIDFQIKGEREYSLGIDNDDSNKFKLSSTAGLDSDTLLTVTTGGNVGIGTSVPTEKLDVRGYLVVAEKIAVNRSRIVLSAPDGSNYKHLFGANLKVTDDGTFTTPTQNISGGGWEYLPANSLNDHGEIRYLSAPDTNATTSTPVERFRIDNDGNIGIGTNNPTQKIHITGIGTTSVNKLRIESYGTAISINNHTDSIGFIGNDEGKFFINAGGSVDFLSLKTNNVQRLGIDSTGNVSIKNDLYVEDNVLIDHDTAEGSGKLQVFTKTADALDILSFDDTAADGGRLTFYRNRNTTYGSNTKVAENDSLGRIDFRGMNTEGTDNYEIGASIRAEVDDTPGGQNAGTDASDMPGRLMFFTTRNGTDSPTEKLRITNIGNLLLTDTSISEPAPYIRVLGKRSDNNVHQSFSGQIALASMRVDGGATSIGITTSKKLGTILFGGNHTNASESNVLYPASIAGVASSHFSSASYMPTDLVFFTGSTGVDVGVNNVSSGTEKLRITHDGYLKLAGNFQFTAANPELEFNNGGPRFRVPAANTLAIHKGGTFGSTSDEALRIDSNGRVIIGHDSTPTAALSLAIVGSYGGSAENTPFVYLCRDQLYNYVTAANSLGHLIFASKDAYRGAVIEGEASNQWTTSNSAGRLLFKTTPNGSTTPSEKMRIQEDGKVGINNEKPQTTLNVKGTISTGRNVAREEGSVISYSSQYTSDRGAANVINGRKNVENGAKDWLTASGQRDNANLIIDLGESKNICRAVIYNQNEYAHSIRECKGFTLEGSNDNASWTTVLNDELGKSNAHEPNPGWSFRIPANYADDVEYVSYRYWRFTMLTFHGSDSFGGITEIELYEHSLSVIDEVTSASVVAGDVYAETGAFKRLTHNGAPKTGHDINGSNGVESGLSIGLDGNRTFLAIGMNGESNLPIIYKTYRINSPGNGLSATHVLMEATSTTNSIVMNGTLTIFPGRGGYNQQRGYLVYAISLSAYSGSLYGFVRELHRLDGSGNDITSGTAMEGFSDIKVVQSGLKVQLEVTTSTAAVGRIMMIWQGQLLDHKHN